MKCWKKAHAKVEFRYPIGSGTASGRGAECHLRCHRQRDTASRNFIAAAGGGNTAAGSIPTLASAAHKRRENAPGGHKSRPPRSKIAGRRRHACAVTSDTHAQPLARISGTRPRGNTLTWRGRRWLRTEAQTGTDTRGKITAEEMPDYWHPVRGRAHRG